MQKKEIDFDILPQEIDKNISFDSICEEKLGMKASSACHLILASAMANTNIKSNAFALDFAILKAEKEKEAYENALKNYKDATGLNGKTDFDLRLETYTEIIKSAKKLKGQI